MRRKKKRSLAELFLSCVLLAFFFSFSAVDGWAFGIDQFAVLLAKKFGCPTKHKQLGKALWGDYYVTSKSTCS